MTTESWTPKTIHYLYFPESISFNSLLKMNSLLVSFTLFSAATTTWHCHHRLHHGSLELLTIIICLILLLHHFHPLLTLYTCSCLAGVWWPLVGRVLISRDLPPVTNQATDWSRLLQSARYLPLNLIYFNSTPRTRGPAETAVLPWHRLFLCNFSNMSLRKMYLS